MATGARRLTGEHVFGRHVFCQWMGYQIGEMRANAYLRLTVAPFGLRFICVIIFGCFFLFWIFLRWLMLEENLSPTDRWNWAAKRIHHATMRSKLWHL